MLTNRCHGYKRASKLSVQRYVSTVSSRKHVQGSNCKCCVNRSYLGLFLIVNIFFQKTRYHVSQSLGYKNGYALPSRPRHAIGGQPLVVNQLTEDALDELANTHPTLTYGNSSKPAPVEFVPGHVAFDKKVRPTLVTITTKDSTCVCVCVIRY